MGEKVGLRHAARIAALTLAIGATHSQPVLAQTANVDLADLSLESLMQMRITSVSRGEEEFLRTPAAVFVITPQDIRRSGATSIAEVLRMVPGADVAQATQNMWAISARGFNAQYATKLLVLVDGRSVYDPSFSGVFWHLVDLPLEDIERIEVIRGPGATMWGANAMNGVISITTKRAADTQGTSVVGNVGTNRPGEASVRYGGALGTKAYYRLFARQTAHSSLLTPDGQDGGDQWNSTDAGFRVDWDATDRDSLTIEGGGYRGVVGNRQQVLTSLAPPVFGDAGLSGNSGTNVMARWTRSLAPKSELALQFYYDGREHTRYGAKTLDTVDVDLQHGFALGARHRMKWGAGYRRVSDDILPSLGFKLLPEAITTHLASGFVQDEVALVPEQLFLTVGSKFEHSSYTHGNVQPAVRALWQPTLRQSVWMSVAQAVRTANRVERGMDLNVGAFPAGDLFGLVQMRGQEGNVSERMTAHEAGYRYQPTRRMWFDFATFYNRYRDLSLIEPGNPAFSFEFGVPHLVLPLTFENTGRGTVYGGEATVHYQAHRALLVAGGYSYAHMNLRTETGSLAAADVEGQSPQHQANISSTLTLPRSVDLSGHVYVVGALPYFALPAYTRVDLNASWKLSDRIGLGLVGQNLGGSHLEFGALPTPTNPVQRSVHAQVSLNF